MRPKKTDEPSETEAEAKQDPFDPFPFEAKDVKTAILLLQSKEKSILLKAIKALSKFASKSKDNVKILFNLGIINNVLPIIKDEDLFVRRFAAKLLAEMTSMSDVTNYLIESDYLPYFVELLTSEDDTFMQEYFSAILAKLTENSYGTALLAKHCSDMDFLFERIQSPDPDIKKNNLEVLYNLMQDLVGARKISKSEKFSFPSLYQHFESQYPEIQCLALNVVASIIKRTGDENKLSLFRETNGVKAILNFLENDEWNDLHGEALKILSFAVENPAIVDELIDIGSIPQMLNYAERTENPKLFTEAFRVIAGVANTSNGRQTLHSCGIVEYLMNVLQRSTQLPDVIEINCYGIGRMALYNPAAKELVSGESVRIISDLLKKEDLQWSTRHAASFALKQLLTSDIRNCNTFLDIRGQDYLLQLMRQFLHVPVEILITILQTLIVVARRPMFRDTLVNFDTVDTICLLLESIHPLADELKIAGCNLLSVLCLEKDGRYYFLKANGPKRLYALITDVHSVPVRNAAVQLIQTISTDLVTASVFVENKYLPYMLNNRSSATVIPSWDTCIETLFKSHLPVKFAFTGRLSLHDLTQDGFYVLRRNVCPFPVLDDIFRFKYCPLEPIYVMNCSEIPSDLQNEAYTEEAIYSVRRNLRAEGTFLSAENINAWLDLKFGRLQYDPYLIEYVKHFKRMLLATEPKDTATTDVGLTNIQYVSSRARMLARFVARQMSGRDPENRCIDHQLEIHLREIKECLGTSVIPLGQLRVGSYLERALLFKVIADRICLPAALVRGEYGVSWIEIAVPQDHRSSVYPVRLMKPNFIVDLMDKPGDLIPIGSSRSRLYCTTRPKTCAKICCH